MMQRRLSSARTGAMVLIALLFALAVPPAIAADIQIPPLTGRVVDQAHILTDAEESRLTSKLRSLEEKTTIQLVIVTLPSLKSRPIEDWGLALGRGWGIGQKGKDNGVLLIVAPNDRELRIEVGYGLEGTLPDATASAIIRNVIVPRFKGGNMAGGISDGANAIIAVLTGGGEEFTPSRTAAVSNLLSQWSPVLFVGFFILLMIIGQFRRGFRGGRYYRNRSGGWLYVDDNDRWSGGSGFSSGGGGGGFSGGGGSFGGGGSSGRW